MVGVMSFGAMSATHAGTRIRHRCYAARGGHVAVQKRRQALPNRAEEIVGKVAAVEPKQKYLKVLAGHTEAQNGHAATYGSLKACCCWRRAAGRTETNRWCVCMYGRSNT